MNTRHSRRYLQTLGDRARFDCEESDLLNALNLKSFDDPDMLRLSYEDPGAFATAVGYLAWRRLVANNQMNRQGYVFWSSLEQGIRELKSHYEEVLGGTTFNLQPPEEYPR